MHKYRAYLLVLGLITHSKCESTDFDLKIMKHIDNSYIPVESSIIEKSGTNFSLLCDLISSQNNSYYDFNLSWMKRSEVRFWREYDTHNATQKAYEVLEPAAGAINKAARHFRPLRPADGGRYVCVSLKYGKQKAVEVEVLVQAPDRYGHAGDAPRRCAESQFRCHTDGLCVFRHYVCDGRRDCRDGSDESVETCDGDPCRDKLQCDDNRCIPASWCCDRHLDANCTVNNRPACCQALTDRYEEMMEMSAHQGHHSNGVRYLFISIGALCVLFVIVLFLLIVSRVMLMARKSDLEENNRMELRHNSSISRQICTRDSIDLIIDNCDVSDPLLFINSANLRDREDQPPPYVDVVIRNVNLNEPPPPYTSREMLNDDERVN